MIVFATLVSALSVGTGYKQKILLSLLLKNTSEFSENVENYAKGLRATTDLSSRKYRHMALEKELESIWV